MTEEVEPGLTGATHREIDQRWCGVPIELESGSAVVQWRAPAEARVDAAGLVHGGFTFGVADHAAMLAVNDPLVVLVGANVRFLAPVAVGDLMVARAQVLSSAGRRSQVECVARVDERVVLEATFECVITRSHPLAGRGGEEVR